MSRASAAWFAKTVLALLVPLYAALGDLDAAFADLECAVEARDPLLVYLGVHARWDPLRCDGRLARMLSRLGLPVIAAAAAS